MADPRQNLRSHILGLIALIHSHVEFQLIAASPVRPQLLALPALVVVDYRVGSLQNVLGRAIILLQADDPGTGILVFKLQDVFNGGTTEAVDGLVVVTHHADIFPFPRQRRGQQILQMVGILILVDEHIAELVLPVLPRLRMLQEQPHRVENQVVKVQRVRLPEPMLILSIELRNLLLAEVAALFALRQVVTGQEHPILCPGNITQNSAGRVSLFI